MRAMRKAVVDALEEAGVSDYSIEHGGKHQKLVVRGPGGQRTISFSATPSCQFAPRKAVRNVRHALKEIGYEV